MDFIREEKTRKNWAEFLKKADESQKGFERKLAAWYLFDEWVEGPQLTSPQKLHF